MAQKEYFSDVYIAKLLEWILPLEKFENNDWKTTQSLVYFQFSQVPVNFPNAHTYTHIFDQKCEENGVKLITHQLKKHGEKYIIRFVPKWDYSICN
jgi:hypothetical protein